MLPVALIADDLTGAMDTGLQFSKRGLETLVSMRWRHLPEAEVIVINTDSRAIRASEAYRRSLDIARGTKGRLLYKKVDSTMRGNVGFELRALCEVLHPRCIVVAPAFPRGGRTTLGGIQRVNGRPLEQTFFAHDPRWPMRNSHLPTLLMQQAGKEVGHVGIEPVTGGVETLMEALRARPEQIIVVDALEQRHLHTIAQALVSLGEGWLPCGSAGLADEWAHAWGLRRDIVPTRPRPGAGPVLIISGSRNDVTTSQLARASDKLGIQRVDLDVRGCHDAEREIGRLSAACLAMLREGRDVILTSSYSPLIAGGGTLVSQVLSGAVARIAARQHLGGLFLTGGDIAIDTCRILDVLALRIAEELQPGIPGGRIIGGACDGHWIVTKAGGFGDEDALLDALAYLHGKASSTTR